MPPKGKKKQEEEPPPEPATLLPEGFAVGCQVYWISCPHQFDDGSVVRAGALGVLEGLPDLVCTENEEGEKSYSLEAVHVLFEGQEQPQTVSITDQLISTSPPLPSAIWNLQPVLARRRIAVPALFEPLSPAATKRAGATMARCPSSSLGSPKSRMEKLQELSPKNSRPGTQMSFLQTPVGELEERSRGASPFIDALFVLEAHPCRTDRVKHLLSPELASFLDDPEFQYTCTSLGGHAAPGRIDWRAIYPWVVDVLKNASLKAGIVPELRIDDDAYTSIIKRFDKNVGAFVCNVPLSENILPFAKFVVAVLYLEEREEARKRAEREAQIRTLLEGSCAQEGDPRVSLLWDSDDVLELRLVLPDALGEINAGEECTDDGEAFDSEEEEALVRPIENISWPAYDPQAVGPQAVNPPPPGDYRVIVQRTARGSGKPCRWACCVTTGGQTSSFCGTWGDVDVVDVVTFTCAQKSPP